ncbi:MAG: patatin [Aureispira sp.]|nr:patatin [Aureispira sp.]
MAKTLRLGFVMGGGVSLGTFSGAALAEAIKQQLVYGHYDTGQKDEAGKPIYAKYDKVEIDVFSGASAGAISLAVMLRVLINPKDKFKQLGYDSYQAFRNTLEQKVSKQFKGAVVEMKMQHPEKYESLLAAQAVQEYQEKIWAKEVDTERFLGVGSYYKDLSNTAGLIDRDVVDELGRRYFQFQSFSDRVDNRVLLADRVLFGCTLANMTYTLKKGNTHHARSEKDVNKSILKALNDSSVDRVHSELRVFDLNFKTIKPTEGRYYPLKWVQYHMGDDTVLTQEGLEGKKYQKLVRNISKNDTWRELTATAIASGAFPFAFEPVVLNRYKYEYAEDWAEELDDENKHPFTYVDGGIFNNEPIREAMRLASYIDTTQGSQKDFHRQVIFVDPNVTELENQFQINVHEQITVSRSILTGKAKIAPKSTLARLVSAMPHVISAILNEAQSIEMGRITKVLERFDRRKNLRNFYKHTIHGVPHNEEIIQMRDFVKKELDLIRNRLELPANTLQIQHELIRVCREEREYFQEHIPIDDERALIDKVNEFVYLPTPSEIPAIQHWLVAMSCVALDISMDLVGKTAHAQLVPIAPFNFYKNGGEDFELMVLPGGSMIGFAGFASHEASAYEVEYGKYCAFKILQELNLVEASNQHLPLPPAFDYSKFDNELKGSLQSAALKRFKEMVPDSFSSVMPFLEGYLSDQIRGFIDRNMDGSNATRTFEFRIRVSSDLFSLRGFGADGAASNKKRVESSAINGEFYLVTQLTYNFDKKEWMGTHCNFLQTLFIDKAKLFEDKPTLAVALPMLTTSDPALYSPNPVFLLDARMQLDKGSYIELGTTSWVFHSDIKPLDETLWGNDKWLEAMDKL